MQFLSTIWIFIQDQILGMKWLSSLIGKFLYAIGLDTWEDWRQYQFLSMM